MSTRIVVTGGAGFLGTLLARRLLGEPVVLGGAPPALVAELVLVDLLAPPPDVRTDGRVRSVTGQLGPAPAELGDVDAVSAGVVRVRRRSGEREVVGGLPAENLQVQRPVLGARGGGGRGEVDTGAQWPPVGTGEQVAGAQP